MAARERLVIFQSPLLQPRHQIKIRLNDLRIRLLKRFIRSIKIDDAFVQHDHTRLQAIQQVLVVRDDHRRLAGGVGVRALQEFVYLPGQRRVQPGRRFVVKHQHGVHRNGAGNSNAFGHPAGQFITIFVDHHIRIVKPNSMKRSRSDRLNLVIGHTFDFAQPQRDVFKHRTREQRVALKHHCPMSADAVHLLLIKRGDIHQRRSRRFVICDPHPPRSRLQVADHVFQQHSLAAPGPADDGQQLSAAHFEVDAAQHSIVAELLVEILYADFDPLLLDVAGHGNAWYGRCTFHSALFAEAYTVRLMAILTVNHLEHSYGTQRVLAGATFGLQAGEKIGLIGRNGSGKTTLFKSIRGDVIPDVGTVQLARGARIGYLSQDPAFDPQDTLRDAAEGAFAELHDLHRLLDIVFEKMATATGDELEQLMRRQSLLEDRINTAGGYAIDHRIDATLHGLGFTDDQFGINVTKLSGGQRNRLGLARLLLEEPDVLLLDEPTNHLDLAGREWLEQFLADEYPGAVIVVSHDRWLLDRVVSRIIEIEAGRIREYPGNYEKYVSLRDERDLTQQRMRDKQQTHIRREKEFIARYKAGQRSRQAKGRESRLQRFIGDELVSAPRTSGVMKLDLPKAPRSGELVVVAEGLSKRYGDNILFDDVNINIQRGDRIGIIGPNGVGKTTIVRCLLNDLAPDSGTVRLGSRLEVGYYRQGHEHLDTSLEVWQYLQSVIIALDGSVQASEQQARNLAGAFLFSDAEQDKALGDLSGGERSRAVLAGLVASAKNLLVLDEPSNHLDIPAAERLEQALSPDGGYDGTLLLISHDRALLQATCDKLLVFDGQGNVNAFHGTYSDWHDHIARSAQQPDEPPADTTTKKSKRSSKTAGLTSAAADQDNTPNPFGKMSTTQLEERIEKIEERIAATDSQLIDPAVLRDGDRVRQVQRDRQDLIDERQPLEHEWNRRAEQA